MSKLTSSAPWLALQAHFEQIRGLHMRQLFAEDPERFSRFSLQIDDFLLDFSKNRITGDTIKLLIELAQACDVPGWIARMFNGDIINHTEHRAVLHVALRNRSNRPIEVQGQNAACERKRNRR